MSVGLNAPYGARCFLTCESSALRTTPDDSLNAPYGARCFLTLIAAGYLAIGAAPS